MTNSTFLINTITAWYEPHRARHQLTYALAKRNDIIFVARNETGPKRIEIQKISDSITLIIPYYPMNYRFRYRLPVVNELYQNWLFGQLKKRYPDVTVINFDFTAHKIFDFYKSVIYYCNDEYVGNSKYPNWLINQYHKKCENKIIASSVFNVSTAPYLTRKMRKVNKHTYEILLGSSPVELPVGYSGLSDSRKGKITVGLLGVINKKQISIKLINEIIEDADFDLVLIGPVDESFKKRLASKSKVRFTGILKGQELLNELMNIDIGIALYNTKLINPGTTPNKLWQYLSVGKPAVVSRIPNLNPDDFPKKTIYLYDDMQSIGKLIHTALSENTKEIANERILFSRKNTWDIRADEFLVLVKNSLG